MTAREKGLHALRPLSTAPEQDLLLVLKRTLFAWLIADGEMHLKNLALLKIAERGSRQFASVRLAPLYDAVTKGVPQSGWESDGSQDQRRVLPIAAEDFRALAATTGIKAAHVDAAIDEVVSALASGLAILARPRHRRNGIASRRGSRTCPRLVKERRDGFA